MKFILLKNISKINNIKIIILSSIVILFISSVLRHELFNSSGDLAVFDQGIYLISEGKPPVSSVLGFHVLADHAAWILYPIALLYKIYPSIYWLFGLQAVALALGGLGAYLLSLQAGLKEPQARAMAAIYLMYPVVYNSNLCDFHPDTIAIPAIFFAIWFARAKKLIYFCSCVLIILGCKAVISLTLIAMGIWLLCFEKRRLYGVIAIILGVIWFLFANSVIIPYFGGEAALVKRHFYRYSYLGNSFSEMFNILLTEPKKIFLNIFSLINLEYLFFLLLPFIWGLRNKYIMPVIGAIPCIALNLLADHQSQKNLVLHYSLPAIPFFLVAIIPTLVTGKNLIKVPKLMILWSLVCFLIFGKFWFFGSKYIHNLDNWSETKQAIALIKTKDSVLTTDIITPHLTHRKLVSFQYNPHQEIKDIYKFNYILLNIRHPGWATNSESLKNLANSLINDSHYHLQFQKQDVFLFTKAN